MTVKRIQDARLRRKRQIGKRVLVLMGSPRHGGNCDMLCDAFLDGATFSGHLGEKVYVADLKISPCKACDYCTKHQGRCAVKDDMAVLMKKIMLADVIVMATPVYFYSIAASLKLVIDRCVARWMQIKDKDFYFIMTSAEDSPSVMRCTLECLRGFIDCLDDVQEKGVIAAKGVHRRGEVKNHPALERAFSLGKQV